MLRTLRNFALEEDGMETAEKTILTVIVVGVAAAVFIALGSKVKTAGETTGSTIEDAATKADEFAKFDGLENNPQ